MEIKILGKGCPRCEEVGKRTINALAELNVVADVRKVKEPKEISSYGVFNTPGLIINNKIKSQGRIPSVSEIKGWIKEETPGE
ncbi:MAG: thioredoxin family protein [Candidatus Aminicenantes bacterium]|nr:thioredoxin family protein [Candidatus Aminicenantes bacterium]MBL7084346.1 thioredoxin family protein [Candidatus Aminicenantes bacterium]